MRHEYTWTDDKKHEIKLVLNYKTGEKTVFRDGVKFLTHAKNIRHKRYDKGIEKVFIWGNRFRTEHVEDMEDVIIPPELVKEVEESYMEMTKGCTLQFDF